MSEQLQLIPTNKNVKKSNYAYVVLIMLGDRYLPGLITTLHSIRRTNTSNNLVVMYTNDVSKSTIDYASKICDYTVQVDKICHPSKPMRTERQREIYSKWVSCSYTKLECIRLPYEKVLFMDIDTVVMDNIDHLFQMQTPASPFSSPFQRPLGSGKNFYSTRDNIDDTGYPKHNTFLTRKQIMDSFFSGGSICTATSLLLTPSLTDFDRMMNILKVKYPNEFGFSQLNAGGDEQLLTYYYTVSSDGPKIGWHNIHQRYNFIAWKKGYIRDEAPMIMHFFSDVKPWEQRVDLWPDVVIWYDFFVDALTSYGWLDNFPDVTKHIVTSIETIPQTYVHDFAPEYLKLNSALELLGKVSAKAKSK